MPLSPYPDPLSHLTARAANRNRMELMMQAHTHWVRSGHLDQSAATGELRDRFMYDWRWECLECRPFKEDKEGSRIRDAFEDHDMWVTVVAESAEERETGVVRDRIRRRASDVGVEYAAVPTYSGVAVMTTGMLLPSSERVDDIDAFVSGVLMPIRWKFTPGAGISGTRGFLPPARPYEFREAYCSDPRDRCWHLHPPQVKSDDPSVPAHDEAKECANLLSLETGDRWYSRWTTPWHTVGRLAVYGEDRLRAIADDCGIEYQHDPRKVATLMFEPLMWDDPKFVQFRHLTGWTPPRPDFIPPSLEMQFRVISNRGLITGHATHWKRKSS
jgi:hypothetical protein